jgi:two-component system cell cycle response regulator
MLGKKLLVADDSLTIQKVIKLALSNEGYEIQTVSDGQDALQQISLFRPDVVLIDVSLPEKTAFEVKREVDEQSDLGFTRFILMSSAYEKVDEAAYKALGFHGRLTKPFDPAHLRKVLNETLEKALAERTERTALHTRPAPPPPEAPISMPPMPAAPPPPVSPAHAPAPPPPLSAQQPHDEDIRELTESTIKMSGLDDLQWSVQERAAKKPEASPPPVPAAPAPAYQEPFLPPPPKMTDLGVTQFSLKESASDYSPISLPEHDDQFAVTAGAAHDFPPSMPAPPPIQYAEEPRQDAYQATESDFSASVDHDTGLHDIPGISQAQPNVMPITTAQMEELLKKQLQETLEAMAKKMLPEIAERIIRAEIHRLLSENGDR